MRFFGGVNDMLAEGASWGLDANTELDWYFYVNEKFAAQREGAD